jgi:hypothetical protein
MDVAAADEVEIYERCVEEPTHTVNPTAQHLQTTTSFIQD